MYSFDNFEFDASAVTRHLFENNPNTTGSISSGSDFFLADDDNSSDSDSFSGFNSDQENTNGKM